MEGTNMQKHFFFAITILFALGCVSTAYADESFIKRYRDYSIEDHGDGTKTNTFGLVEYVWNGSEFVDRIIGNNGTHFNVYSEMGSFSFDKSDCTITQYAAGFDPISQVAHSTDIMIDSWAWTIARKNGANQWEVVNPTLFACSISTHSNSTGKYLTMTRGHASGSYLKVTLAAPEGKPVEDFNEFYMNIPGWSGNQFAYVLWAKGVNATGISFKNGTTFTIPQGTTLINHTQLNIESLEFIKNGNAFYFDWKKAASEFKSLLLIKSGNNLDLQFGFNRNPVILTTGQKMFMDPTYGYTAATTDYSARTTSTTATTCGPGNSKVLNDRQMQKEASGAAGLCIIDALQWDLSSIPNTASVTNSSVQVQVSAVGNGINCDLTEVTSDITAANVTALYSDIVNGTVYVSNNNFCASTGTKDLDLGATADTDIQVQLSGDSLFGLGLKYTSMVRDGALHTMNWIAAGANGFQLRVTYSVIPAAPTNLACTGAPYRVNCTWTASVPGDGITGYYLSTSLTNASGTFANFTNAGNTTSGSVMYLGIGKLYYVQVNATTGSNSTASYATATTDTKPTVPLNPYLTQNTTSFVKLNWQNVSSDGGDTVFGFRIDFCFDLCTAWLNWVNQTSTLNYNQTTPQWHVGKWRIGAWNGVGLSPYTANLTNGPDRVTDLTDTYIQDTILGLDWSTPSANGYSILGYMINYTTPWNPNPSTAIVNDTGNTATLYDVSGLTEGTDYSFRVGPITTFTKQMIGNHINVTTDTFTAANFTIGFINFNSTNSARPDIIFTRTDLNSTNTLLTIDYTPTLTLNCDLAYQFAQTNRTYTNLTSVIVDGNKQSSFQFLNGNNDIVTIYCWDAATNTTGRYQLTQADFELLNQIENFRNGTYGTMGLIGVLDLVTFVVIILAMIGFNRLNDTVGIIFSLVVVFVAAYFEIITDPVLIIPMLALIALLAVINTRKD